MSRGILLGGHSVWLDWWCPRFQQGETGWHLSMMATALVVRCLRRSKWTANSTINPTFFLEAVNRSLLVRSAPFGDDRNIRVSESKVLRPPIPYEGLSRPRVVPLRLTAISNLAPSQQTRTHFGVVLTRKSDCVAPRVLRRPATEHASYPRSSQQLHRKRTGLLAANHSPSETSVVTPPKIIGVWSPIPRETVLVSKGGNGQPAFPLGILPPARDIKTFHG